MFKRVSRCRRPVFVSDLTLEVVYYNPSQASFVASDNEAKANVFNKLQLILFKIGVRSGGRTAFIPMTPE